MGSFDALSTAVSGLQAQSFALQNISGNIANAQTTAFKSTDTNFADLVLGSQVSDSVQWRSDLTNSSQGAIQTETVSTYMAIKGSGYFTVAAPGSPDANGQPTISAGTPTYTRRGDFQLNKNGYLVNGAGDYLMGSQIDPSTNAAASTTLQPLHFDTATAQPGPGTLQSLSVSSDGTLQGTYSQGKTVDVASLPVATFRGQSFMQQGDGGTFTATAASGAAQYTNSTTVVGDALEASNVDLATQMTTLIQAQQAYGANTKVVTASNEMLQTLTGLTL